VAHIARWVGQHLRGEGPQVAAGQLLQWTMRRQRKIEHPAADTVDPTQGVVEEVGRAQDRVGHIGGGEFGLDNRLAVEVRHPAVLVCPRNRTEYQVRNPCPPGGGQDRSALFDFGIHPGLERGGQSEHPGHPDHCCSQRRLVVERPGDHLDPSVGQPAGRARGRVTHQSAHLRIARE
jgi:hypothetical protein